MRKGLHITSSVRQFVETYYSLILPLAINTISVVVSLLLILSKNSGVFTYTLDDAYIHLTLARNYVEYGAFGIVPHQFSSTTSSPLWSLILIVLFSALGPYQYVPLLLNVLIANLLILYMWRTLTRDDIPGLYVFISLTLMIFVISIINLIFSGLEHLLFILFMVISLRIFSSEIITRTPSRSSILQFYVVVALMVATRYEGLFVALAYAILMAAKRMRISAGIVLSAGISPIVYGLISLSNGWFVVSDSLLVRTMNNQGPFDFLVNIPSALISIPSILTLLAMSLGLLMMRHDRFTLNKESALCFVFVFVSLLHLEFLPTGWFFRYEAYLMALGLYAVTVQLKKYYPVIDLMVFTPLKKPRLDPDATKRMLVFLIFIGMMTFPLVVRGDLASINVPNASNNIYEQQYQMAMFLNRYYSGKTVGMNDIGAASFYANIKCIGLFGLGNLDVAKAKMNGSYGEAFLQHMAEIYHIDIVLIYKTWFENIIPSEWILVGNWTVQHNYVLGGTTVSFFATNTTEATLLRSSLVDFYYQLPSDVIQAGNYTAYV